MNSITEATQLEEKRFMIFGRSWFTTFLMVQVIFNPEQMSNWESKKYYFIQISRKFET